MCVLAYIPPEKRCAKCRDMKPWDEFWSDSRSGDGMAYRCRDCQKPKSRKDYQRNQPKRVAYARQRRVTHKQQVNQEQHAFYLRHQERLLAEKRAAYAADPDKMRARTRTNHANHRTERNITQRLNYAANPEKWVEWRAEHLPSVRLIASRRRARKRALPDTFTLAERQFMLEYWRHSCAICGNEEGFFWTLADDHFIPLSSPDCPGTIAENMLPLCHTRKGTVAIEGNRGCNNSKNDSAPETWLASRYSRVQASRLLKAIHAYFAVVKARQAQEIAS